MDKPNILNKYNKPEDKLLVSKMIDKLELSIKKNKIEYTDFLDMHQKHLLEKILNREQICNYIIDGGQEESERNAIIFYPSKMKEIVALNYRKILPFDVLRIKLPKEMYNKYNHRDYLGGLMKLGIKREKIGDILVFEEGADIIVMKEITNFLITNISLLTRFSKSTIELVKLEEMRKKEIQLEEKQIIVSSMRLDCVISELIKTSRGKVEDLLNQGLIFVNFENISKSAKQIKENDIITVRKNGRFKIGKIIGTTKNNKIKLIAYKYI